jgi:hypothetical protein
MMLLPLQLGSLDVMLGSRVRTRRECLESGMPLYKYLGNRMLTLIENICLGQNMGEFHSGFRAYRREVLETIPFERFSDDFVFDSQLLVSAVDAGFRLGEIPVPVRYMPEASSIGFQRSVRTGSERSPRWRNSSSSAWAFRPRPSSQPTGIRRSAAGFPLTRAARG